MLVCARSIPQCCLLSYMILSLLEARFSTIHILSITTHIEVHNILGRTFHNEIPKNKVPDDRGGPAGACERVSSASVSVSGTHVFYLLPVWQMKNVIALFALNDWGAYSCSISIFILSSMNCSCVIFFCLLYWFSFCRVIKSSLNFCLWCCLLLSSTLDSPLFQSPIGVLQILFLF